MPGSVLVPYLGPPLLPPSSVLPVCMGWAPGYACALVAKAHTRWTRLACIMQHSDAEYIIPASHLPAEEMHINAGEQGFRSNSDLSLLFSPSSP